MGEIKNMKRFSVYLKERALKISLGIIIMAIGLVTIVTKRETVDASSQMIINFELYTVIVAVLMLVVAYGYVIISDYKKFKLKNKHTDIELSLGSSRMGLTSVLNTNKIKDKDMRKRILVGVIVILTIMFSGCTTSLSQESLKIQMPKIDRKITHVVIETLKLQECPESIPVYYSWLGEEEKYVKAIHTTKDKNGIEITDVETDTAITGDRKIIKACKNGSMIQLYVEDYSLVNMSEVKLNELGLNPKNINEIMSKQ